MTVVFAECLFWTASMQTFNYGKWYMDVTASTGEEDIADGIPQLYARLRFAAERGMGAAA